MNLCDFLLQCAQIERTIEVGRQQIVKLPTFHPYQTFKIIDSKDEGRITAQGLQLFLYKYGYLHTLKECTILFYKSELKYIDFLRFILPSNQLLRDFISFQEQKEPQNNQCLFNIAKHISNEIKLMNELKPPLSLDQLIEGTREEIQQLFQKKHFFVYQDEIDAMIKRLDFYGDGKIDLLLIKNWVLLLNTSNQLEYDVNYNTPKKSVTFQKNIKDHNQPASTEKKQVQFNKKQQLDKSQIRGKFAQIKQQDFNNNKQSSQTQKKTAIKIKQKSPCEILEYLIDLEIKKENIKKDLALHSDFNPYNIFKSLDIYNRGRLGQEELDQFMNQKLNTSLPLLNHFQTNELKYEDFLTLIQPQTSNYAEVLNSRIPIMNEIKKPITQLLQHKTIKLLKDLFKIYQQLPVKLQGNENLFNKIDIITRDGFIGVSDLQQYLYENGLRYTHQEVMLLINTFDNDRDGRLSLNEFLII